jgi:biotin carboxylase
MWCLGVRAVRQANCRTKNEVTDFLETLRIPGSADTALRCVVKPVQSAGSDDVFLCQSIEEALVAFGKIFGTVNGIGLLNDCVLVQEFLVGKEYVVDKVSRDGVHKIVAIWEYDKRRVNGANFVYFGMRLIPSSNERVPVLCEYADKVLDAVGIINGPSHMEVMLNTIEVDGKVVFDPCLVEVGARCHGGEGTWLPMTIECIGYNQVTMTVDAYLDGSAFSAIEHNQYPVKKVFMYLSFSLLFRLLLFLLTGFFNCVVVLHRLPAK